MRIWVDADACPNIIKDILIRASNRTEIHMILVANQPLRIIPSAFIKNVQVSSGFDVADNHIVQNLQPGDLVITADIPLADAVVSKGCLALNPRGELYSDKNIKERLSFRDFNTNLRSSGIITGGPATLSKKEIHQFASNLDQVLLSHIQKNK